MEIKQINIPNVQSYYIGKEINNMVISHFKRDSFIASDVRYCGYAGDKKVVEFINCPIVIEYGD